MSEDSGSPLSGLNEKVEAIVEEGGDVRGKVAALVAGTSELAQKSGESLLTLSRSVMDAASQAISKGKSSLPADGALRQVIDGLGDGLTSAAVSAKMAVEEARAEGKRFASEDLSHVREDLGTLTSLYVQTVADALSRTKTEATTSVSALLSHAEQARDRMLPSLKSAIEAARQDPVGAGVDSVRAGLAASQHAAGSLFSAMGQILQRAGEQMKGGPPEESAK